jgi:hypothetical protein
MRQETLEALVREGKLQVGTELHHSGRLYPDRSITATVVKDGIRLRGQVFPTPSAAAQEVTGNSVNGWLFWHLPDGTNLGALRDG